MTIIHCPKCGYTTDGSGYSDDTLIQCADCGKPYRVADGDIWNVTLAEAVASVARYVYEEVIKPRALHPAKFKAALLYALGEAGWSECPRCEGSGIYNFRPCSVCEGTGSIADQCCPQCGPEKSEPDCPCFEAGVAAVSSIRCLKHQHVPQITRHEVTGQECGACVREETLKNLKPPPHDSAEVAQPAGGNRIDKVVEMTERVTVAHGFPKNRA